MPCVSTPRRLAARSEWATISAFSLGTPAFSSAATQNSESRDDLKRRPVSSMLSASVLLF
jgi:hypothetical protein